MRCWVPVLHACCEKHPRPQTAHPPISTHRLPPPASLRREHIRWPPSNYSSEAQRSYLEAFCSSLPPAEQRVARAQLRRVQLMQRWLAGELTTQQAAEEERRIQQAAA